MTTHVLHRKVAPPSLPKSKTLAVNSHFFVAIGSAPRDGKHCVAKLMRSSVRTFVFFNVAAVRGRLFH